MRTSLTRRLLAVATSLTASAALATLVPAPAHADDSTTLAIVGTSDVSDSNLFAAVLKPGFEAATRSTR